MSRINTASRLEIQKLESLESPLNYKQIKIECVIRGMGFDEIIGGDYMRLSAWLLNNIGNSKKLDKLNEFDDFIEGELLKRDRKDLIHPSLRLGFVDDSESKRSEKVKVKMKPKKEKVTRTREKDKNGIVKKTKKSYTFRLQQKGYNVKKVIRKVLKKFPDANEKSIKIWFRKSERS